MPNGLFFQLFRAENVKRIPACQHVPAEMGLGRPLSEYGFGFEFGEHPVLSAGYVIPEWGIDTFGPVEIDELESCVPEFCDTVRHLILQV